MPLLDHFHPPLYPYHPWESFLSNWATRLTDAVMERLPREFHAEEHIHAGRTLEMNVTGGASMEQSLPALPDGPMPDMPALIGGTSPTARFTIPGLFPDSFEVRVYSTVGGRTLVGAIALLSPGNKDRLEERCAFAAKCASYLYKGVSLILIDIVTNRRANLHNDTVRLMEAGPQYELPDDGSLYAVAYRPVLRQGQAEIDVWPATFRVGEPLPQLPLRLTGDLFIPVNFETAYQETCRRRRLA